MTTPSFPHKKERITIDISIQDPEWERIKDVENIVRVAVLCALNAIDLPTKEIEQHLKRDLEVSVVLANDSLLQVLNREYREKDTPTNILTFATLDSEEPVTSQGALNLGDIVLSFETIRKESKEQDKFVLDHLKHLIVHGVLHLLGFDHKIESEATDMETLEIRILEQLDVRNPYTEALS